jgi:hypothetical protein
MENSSREGSGHLLTALEDKHSKRVERLGVSVVRGRVVCGVCVVERVLEGWAGLKGGRVWQNKARARVHVHLSRRAKVVAWAGGDRRYVRPCPNFSRAASSIEDIVHPLRLPCPASCQHLSPIMPRGHMKYRHLSRSSSHRQALLRNLVTSLFKHESIATTWHKAKEAQRLAEQLVTLGKKNTEATRRRAHQIFFVCCRFTLEATVY